MPVDSFKFLPRSFRAGYESLGLQADSPAWALLDVPIEKATVALLTSAGLFLPASQEPFDIERERNEPLWGDPTYRVIPKDVAQEEVGAAHLHLNTRDFLDDFNVVLPLRPFRELASNGEMGALAAENYSFMGFQERGAPQWKTTFGPEVAHRLRDAGVSALVLAPA